MTNFGDIMCINNIYIYTKPLGPYNLHVYAMYIYIYTYTYMIVYNLESNFYMSFFDINLYIYIYIYIYTVGHLTINFQFWRWSLQPHVNGHFRCVFFWFTITSLVGSYHGKPTGRNPHHGEMSGST